MPGWHGKIVSCKHSISGYIVPIPMEADGQCACISLSSYVKPIALEADGHGACISLSGYCVVPIPRQWQYLVL